MCTVNWNLSWYGTRGDVIVLIGEEGKDTAQLLPEVRICQISGMDWNRDLSPWPAPRVFSKGEDFAGQGDRFLAWLNGQLPAIRQAADGQNLYLAGYSLAGLFTLYAGTKIPGFAGLASVSGSLWYPGFAEYLETHTLLTGKVYLSLGDREKNTKNPVMRQVEDQTIAVQRLVQGYAQCHFETNPGNHFQDPPGRLARGIRWLLKAE